MYFCNTIINQLNFYTMTTINKDFITFSRNGEIKQFNNVVGTWKKHCPKQQKDRTKVFCRHLVNYYYTAKLINGKDFFAYTKKELKECFDRQIIH